MSRQPRILYVFRTVDEALIRFPRQHRRPTDVVASAGSLDRWPHQLLGQRFTEAHLFHAIDATPLRLIRQSLMHTGGPIHRPGLLEALPAMEDMA